MDVFLLIIIFTRFLIPKVSKSVPLSADLCIEELISIISVSQRAYAAWFC